MSVTDAPDRIDLLRQLVDALPDPVYVKDDRGRYLVINGAAARFLGLEPGEVLGRTDEELFEGETLELMRADERRVMEGGETVTFERRARDGSGAERDLLVTKGPLLGDDGAISAVYGIFRDVTSARRTEEALRRSEATLRERVKEQAALVGAMAALARHDRAFEQRLLDVVELVPPGWQYPRITEARLAVDGIEAATPGFRPTPWIMRSPVRAGGEFAGVMEVAYLEERPDAAEGPFLAEERTLLDALADRVGEAVERRRIEEQFLQAQKLDAVGRLAGGIAQEFNNLLTALAGHLDIVREGVPEDHELRLDVDAMHDAVNRAVGLTARLLALSRDRRAEGRVIDMAAEVAAVRETLASMLGEDVSLEIEAPARPLPVRIEPSHVDRLLLNLCLNGREAMPGGGRIRVGLARETLDAPRRLASGEVRPGEWAVLEVEDSGEGMDEATLQRAFEPFFTTRKSARASGLGLTVVQATARRAGGEVDLISRPGQGTRARVYLPVSPEGAPDVTEGADGPRDGRAGILLVEDDETVRALLRRVLERHGYTVDVAGDGREALAGLRSGAYAPDLVLSDVVMPDLGGPALAREMRAAGIDTPVLFMTGYSEQQVPGPDEVSGVLGLIEKPFAPAELLDHVSRALRRLEGDS